MKITDYIFEDGIINVRSEDSDDFVEFCEEVKVPEIKKNIINGEETLTVTIVKNGVEVPISVSREKLCANPVVLLSKYGLSLANNPDNASALSDVLNTEAKNAPVVNFHEVIGFKDYQGGLTFFSGNVIPGIMQSNHKEEKYHAKGNFDEWKTALLPYLSRTELQLAITLGASSPIAYILNVLSGVELETSAFALIGMSSTGKTTALKLSASVWGNPSSTSGILENILNTENYFYGKLAELKGFPFYIDDVTVKKNKDFTELIYKISQGRETGRSFADGTPREKKCWYSSVVFTGESSMLDCTNKQMGLYARLIEFSCQWTDSAESAERISEIISKNYGTAHIPFVELLLNLSPDDVKADYQTEVENVQAELFANGKIPNGVEKRIIKKFALILVTAKYLEAAWGISFDRKGFMRIFTEALYANDVHDLVRERYEAIVDYVTANGSKFSPEKSGSNQYFSSSYWGIYGKHNGRKCVWIVGTEFRKIVPSMSDVKDLLTMV